MTKYIQKKPKIIKAIQWTGDNTDEVIEFGTIGGFKEIQTSKEFHSYLPADKLKEIKNYLVVSQITGIGDEAFVGDYILIDGDLFVMSSKDFESKFKPTKEKNVYVAKTLITVEAIKWVENNTEQVLSFLDKNGGLEKTGTQILIMNYCGGSVAEKGDYIVKQNGDCYSMTEEDFLDIFEKVWYEPAVYKKT